MKPTILLRSKSRILAAGQMLILATAATAAISLPDVVRAQTAVNPAPANQTATGVVYVDANENRVRDQNEKPLADVRVSNGRDVVVTDAEGRYSLPVDNDSIVFVIKPTGFRTVLDQDNLSRFYYNHKPAGSPKLDFPGVDPTGPLPKSVDFPLYPREEPIAFDVIFFGDPQPRDQKEIDYIAHDVVEDLVGVKAAFGVTLGDILFDDLSLFDSFNRTLGKIGVPWYNVIGNHDINYASEVDELSDETYERVYGPPYYSFDYGSVHFVVVDDVHWLREGDKKLYKSGLSEKQLAFIENDLKLVPQDRLVVAMMHIPFVKSTPWLAPRREKLLELLQSRQHCISLAGHTHHHEQVMMDKGDGWKGEKPHHHIINVTVCGSWWTGKPDEHGIPHTLCADGTPNGYTVMHFDGIKYLLEYRAARRGPNEQIRITAPEVVSAAKSNDMEFRANVFNAMPGAVVEYRIGDEKWRAMKKTTKETDPLFQSLYDEEQKFLPGKPGWRPLGKPMVCPHLWRGGLTTKMPPGTYLIEVRATNPNGQVLTGQRFFRVQ